MQAGTTATRHGASRSKQRAAQQMQANIGEPSRYRRKLNGCSTLKLKTGIPAGGPIIHGSGVFNEAQSASRATDTSKPGSTFREVAKALDLWAFLAIIAGLPIVDYIQHG